MPKWCKRNLYYWPSYACSKFGCWRLSKI